MTEYSLTRLLGAKPEDGTEPLRQAVVSAAQMQQIGQDYKHAVDLPGGQPWEGYTARAAQETAAADEKTVYRTGQVILDEIPKALDTLVFQAVEHHSRAVGYYNEATSNGYTVSEDLTAEWIVQPRSTPAIIEKGKANAAKFTQMIRGAYDKWWDAELDVERQVNAISNEMDISFNPIAALTAAQGREDAAALQAGRILDPDVLARVQAASTLGDQDLATLAAGKDVTVSSNRMQYIYQLAHGFDGKTPAEVEAIKAGLPKETQAAITAGLLPKKAGEDAQTSLVRAFSMLSDDQIKSGVKNLGGVTDASKGNFIPAAGSVANLPDSFRDALTNSDRVGVSYNASSPNMPPRTELHGVGDLQDVAKFFDGAGGYLNGSEAGRSMLDAASQYTNADIDRAYGISSDAHGDLKSALGDIYQVAANDHVDVADLADKSAHAPKDTDSFLSAVNGERWDGQGGKLAGVFDWAANDPNDPMAGKLANAEAHYLADPAHHDELQNLAHREIGQPHSFAEANPEIAKSVARLEAPHIAELAGAENHSPSIEAFKNSDQLQNMMSGLDRNEDAAKIINGAAYQQYSDTLGHAAQMPGDTPHDLAHRDTSYEVGGRIRQGMVDGATDALNLHDPVAANNKLGEWAAGKIPMVGEYLGAVDGIDQALQPPGNPADAAHQMVTTGQHGFSTIDSYKAALNGLIHANPGIANDPALTNYVTNGQLDPHKIAEISQRVDMTQRVATDLGEVLRRNNINPDSLISHESAGMNNRVWQSNG